jgi:hypothetical protein
VKRELERLYWLALRHNRTKSNNVAVVLCVDDSFIEFANSALVLALKAAFGKESIDETRRGGTVVHIPRNTRRFYHGQQAMGSPVGDE